LQEGVIVLKNRISFTGKKNAYRFTLYIIIGILFLFILIVAAVLSGQDRILKGTYISGVNVSDMTYEQAQRTLIENFQEKLKYKTITIIYREKFWKIKSSDIDARLDIEKAVKDAYEIKRNTGYFDRILIQLRLKKVAKKITLGILFNDESISKTVKSIRNEIARDPVDATISFQKGRFVVTRDIPGVDVETDKLILMIKDTFNIENPGYVVNVPVVKVEALKKYEMLKAINTKISSFRTLFRGSSNRISNIKLSTGAVDGKVIMPGEVFSLNKALGPRIPEYGYREAPIIVDGQVVQGTGGGVCQVATTLYNAALLADLDIIERKNHGLHLEYISLGRDAAISGDYLDLKFRNNRKYPVYIRGYIYGNGIYFEIYSDNTTPNMKVEITTDIIEIITPKAPKIIEDYSLPEGVQKIKTKPRMGYRVKSYRKTYINNVLVRSEELGDDYYRAVNGVIIVGKKPR